MTENVNDSFSCLIQVLCDGSSVKLFILLIIPEGEENK